MLKNIKVKQINDLNNIFEIGAEKICESNKDILLGKIFKNYYYERIFDLAGVGVSTVYSITYDEIKEV